MKRCPTCRCLYPEETLNFCRVDGAELAPALDVDESPTRLMEPSHQQSQSYRTIVIKPSAPSAPTPTAIAASTRPSIAVLPFTPLQNSSGDEYLGLGIADSLITRLSGINRITVRPTSAVLKYANLGQDSLEAGREQRVDAVLEGSIQRLGERIRVSARLINVTDGASVWGYQADEDCADIFQVEDSFTEQIVTSLVKNLTREEERQVTKRYTENTEAFHLYLKGRYHWNKFTDDELAKAIEYFSRAVEEDPSYALAYSALADCYSFLGVNSRRPVDSFPKAKAAALRALELDDTLAEAHISLAAVKILFDWDLSGAARELKRAIDLNNSCATAYDLYAIYEQALGRVNPAIALLEQAQELDPLSSMLNWDLGWAYNHARQYDLAIEQGLKAVAKDPTFAFNYLVLGMAYEHKGMHTEALTELAKAEKLSNESPRISAWLGYVYAKIGSTAEARQILDKLTTPSRQSYIDPYNLAVVYMGLGENEKALASLGDAVKEHSGQLLCLKLEPIFDDLRSDPRFTRLLQQTLRP